MVRPIVLESLNFAARCGGGGRSTDAQAWGFDVVGMGTSHYHTVAKSIMDPAYLSVYPGVLKVLIPHPPLTKTSSASLSIFQHLQSSTVGSPTCPQHSLTRRSLTSTFLQRVRESHTLCGTPLQYFLNRKLSTSSQ